MNKVPTKKINKKFYSKDDSNKTNKKKVFIFIVILVIIITFLIFFLTNKSKTKKFGKNSSSQDILNYILDISSYESTIEVEVKSNKNTNKYVIKQQYIKDKAETQEVIEPSNIQGVKIVKKDNVLRLENTNLNITTILEKYNYLTNNNLDLSSFIEDYKKSESSSYEEENNELILKTTSDNNKYTKNKTLHVDKTTGKPLKMEITDINKNTTVYILYKEVKIDELDENNILAFSLYNTRKEV